MTHRSVQVVLLTELHLNGRLTDQTMAMAIIIITHQVTQRQHNDNHVNEPSHSTSLRATLPTDVDGIQCLTSTFHLTMNEVFEITAVKTIAFYVQLLNTVIVPNYYMSTQ